MLVYVSMKSLLRNPSALVVMAAVFAAAAVALGAFGAHALRPRMETRLFDIYQTAVHYHFLHALALLGLAALAPRLECRLAAASGLFLIGGILLFSGSLYLYTLAGMTAITAVTPVGGMAFIVGWLLLALAARKARHTQPEESRS